MAVVKKAVVIIPTYNERDNIEEMISAISSLKVSHGLDILIVDSASPDGTGEFVEELRKRMPRLIALHQPKKMGLGRAYLDGLNYLRFQTTNVYDAVITMDADFSHHPRYLSMMFEQLDRGYDLVVGSRYVSEGRLENWSKRRKWLSRFANFYAMTLTGVPLHDLTSGFHCFRWSAMKQIRLEQISADGYAFLIELKYFSWISNLKITEIPIVFSDRTKGASKISKWVIFESALIPWRYCFKRMARHFFVLGKEISH